jgi:two-component system cell cycle response regulator
MADKVGETSIIRPTQLRSGALDACFIHIYPTGPSMGRRYALGAQAVVLGRGEGCDIRVNESSVSRRHARVEPVESGYAVADLGSTNGTFVNDRQTTGVRQLEDGDYLRVGNCIYRFLTGGNIESEYHEEIYRLTIVDGLTQLHNRRYLTDFLEREIARSRRHHRPLAVLMMDLDHFKVVNDDNGHLAGDYVLREMSARLRPSVRREDLFARYGGEEFCLVLVETDLPEAADVAERVRAAIAAEPFRFEDAHLTVTLSVGVAITDGNEDLSPEGLLKLADDKLYAAKRAGRNRVVT